jgi:predicted metal-dependent enzyme (double-stranded beta helix superfamily)
VITLDSPVRALFERIAAPASLDEPDLEAIGAALVELAGDTDYMRRWTEKITGPTGRGNGSLPIHAPERGPRLMIVHRPEGEMSAPHDHGTWVALAPIVGIETHRRYRSVGEDDAALELVESRALVPEDVVTLLPPDDIHDHGHIAGRGNPAHVLIMTGDDQMRYTRNEWDLATGRRRVLHPGEAGRWLASEPMP